VGQVLARVTARGGQPPLNVLARRIWPSIFNQNITTFTTFAMAERPITPPGRFKNSDLSRDERLQVQTLRNAGFSYDQIVQELGFTYTKSDMLAALRTPRRKSALFDQAFLILSRLKS
jgi:hypothetical protein